MTRFVTWSWFVTSLLCLWNSPGKNTGVGSHVLLQGIFLTQGAHLTCPLPVGSVRNHRSHRAVGRPLDLGLELSLIFFCFFFYMHLKTYYKCLQVHGYHWFVNLFSLLDHELPALHLHIVNPQLVELCSYTKSRPEGRDGP